MTIAERYAAWFPDNPVMRAERSYQERSTERRARRWRRGLARLVKTVLIGMSIGMIGAGLLGSLLGIDIGDAVNDASGWLTLFAIFVTTHHFGVMINTLSLGANSIAREKQGQTWDMLVLTGIDARQIVRGKWAATVRRQLPAYLVLAVMRIGAIVLYSVVTNSLFSFTVGYGGDRLTYLPHPLSYALLAGVVTLMTLANLVFTAACGVWASAVTQRPAMAQARAIGTRIVLLLVPSFVVLFFFGRFLTYDARIGPLYDLLLGAGLTLVDNGATAGANLVAVRYGWEGSPPSPLNLGLVLASTLAALGIYALWTVVALRRAQTLAVKHLATPPE
ncbi:MAG: hypothetical protein JNM70_09035 [Anaerolineae bacterium]|nr:hypothetical protein [Anaerolineae bacterium]